MPWSNSFRRAEFVPLFRRLEHEQRRAIQVVYGPRQVGKSTLMAQIAQESRKIVHMVSADSIPVTDAYWIRRQWDQIRVRLAAESATSSILILDEIQKIPHWSEQVKKEWDADTLAGLPIHVVLLGSSRVWLQKGLSESLAGRFETTYLGHWSYQEMRDAFGFNHDQYVWFGGYPGAAPFIDDEARWKAYIRDSLIDSSIHRDVLMLTPIQKPALMRRLFDLGTAYSGQMVSYTKLMGQLHDAGNTTTLAHYLDALDSAGLLAGIEKYSPDKLRQRASSPKFQVHNLALMSAGEAMSFSEVHQQPERWGRWVESAIGAHLLNFARKTHSELFYWREGDDEVDFVLRHRHRVVAIEVKSGARQSRSGLDAFAKKHHPDRMVLIGKDGIPWQSFLEMDPANL